MLSALMSIRVDIICFDSNAWNVSSTNPALSPHSLRESPKDETVHEREEDGPVGRALAGCAAVRSDPKRERSDRRRFSRRSVAAGIARPPLPARRSRAHGGRSHCAVIVSLLPQPKESSLVLLR